MSPDTIINTTTISTSSTMTTSIFSSDTNTCTTTTKTTSTTMNKNNNQKIARIAFPHPPDHHTMTTETLDQHYLQLAISLAHQCIPSTTAFSVGAVLVNPDGVLATGYSRELPGNTHAEEVCFLKLTNQEWNQDNVTLYSTMEPCSHRLSGKLSCLDWILKYKLHRVVIGIQEPTNFVQCTSIQQLNQAGVQCVQYSEFEQACWAPNRHLMYKMACETNHEKRLLELGNEEEEEVNDDR